jgi:uncharacterized membrane protein
MPIAFLVDHHPSRSFVVHRVSWLQPFAWLRAGWNDLRHHAWVSFAHGLLIAGFWLVLLGLIGTHPYCIAAVLSGFMLIGPVMTSGLCELSRRRTTGEALTFDGSLEGFSRNEVAMLKFSLLLLGVTVVWFVLSVLLLQSVLHRPEPALTEILYGGFLGSSSPQQLLEYLALGGVLAALVFCMSVVAVPLLLDRHATAGEALRTSVKAVLANIPAMLVWGGLLLLLAGIGVASLLLGLIVVVPLMGHATWHAYRDLID